METNTNKDESRYMRIGAAAKYIGVHINTLHDWDSKGVLVPERFGVRRDRRYTKEQLDNFIRKHRENGDRFVVQSTK